MGTNLAGGKEWESAEERVSRRLMKGWTALRVIACSRIGHHQAAANLPSSGPTITADAHGFADVGSSLADGEVGSA